MCSTMLLQLKIITIEWGKGRGSWSMREHVTKTTQTICMQNCGCIRARKIIIIIITNPKIKKIKKKTKTSIRRTMGTIERAQLAV